MCIGNSNSLSTGGLLVSKTHVRPYHAAGCLNTLLRGAALLGSTPYAGLMMLLASQDFRRISRPGPSPGWQGSASPRVGEVNNQWQST